MTPELSVKCPYCGTGMIPGEASIKGTFLEFLIVGLSAQHLWFKRDDGSKKEKIIHSGDQRAGHQCPKCGAVTVQRFRREWKRAEDKW